MLCGISWLTGCTCIVPRSSFCNKECKNCDCWQKRQYGITIPRTSVFLLPAKKPELTYNRRLNIRRSKISLGGSFEGKIEAIIFTNSPLDEYQTITLNTYVDRGILLRLTDEMFSSQDEKKDKVAVSWCGSDCKLFPVNLPGLTGKSSWVCRGPKCLRRKTLRSKKSNLSLLADAAASEGRKRRKISPEAPVSSLPEQSVRVLPEMSQEESVKDIPEQPVTNSSEILPPVENQNRDPPDRSVHSNEQSMPSPENKTPDPLPERSFPARDLPERSFPAQDLPEQNFPARDLPEQNFPARDLPEQNFPAQEILYRNPRLFVKYYSGFRRVAINLEGQTYGFIVPTIYQRLMFQVERRL